jgi:phosphatidylglycerophosphatase C
MPTVAAFDVDGTLTTRDSVVPFLWLVGRWRLVGGLLAHPLVLVRALARRDRDRLKALAVAAVFSGRPYDEVRELGRRHVGTFFERRLRVDTADRLHWHQSQGHRVVLVSASLHPYLEPFGEQLGVDQVLCSRLEVDESGRCTGALVGPNCRGAEKVRRLDAWLDAEDLTAATVWAYGDSSGDAELLTRAQHPVKVPRERLMEAVA